MTSQAHADTLQNRFFVQLYLKKTSTHVLYCEFAKFFDSKPSMASADLLFLIKSNEGRFQLKRVDLAIIRDIYILLVESISTHFY